MKTEVTLYSPSLGVSRRFGAEHAERLLRIPGSGWELSDKRYTFDKRHGIRVRRAKEEAGGAS